MKTVALLSPLVFFLIFATSMGTAAKRLEGNFWSAFFLSIFLTPLAGIIYRIKLKGNMEESIAPERSLASAKELSPEENHKLNMAKYSQQ